MAIAYDSYYRTVQPLPNKPNSDDFKKKLYKLYNACKQGGFVLKEIHIDK